MDTSNEKRSIRQKNIKIVREDQNERVMWSSLLCRHGVPVLHVRWHSSKCVSICFFCFRLMDKHKFKHRLRGRETDAFMSSYH